MKTNSEEWIFAECSCQRNLKKYTRRNSIGMALRVSLTQAPLAAKDVKEKIDVLQKQNALCCKLLR